MGYTITEIYRVVYTDQYQHTEPETYWTTDKKACYEYIQRSCYRSSLHIQVDRLSNNVLKIKT